MSSLCLLKIHKVGGEEELGDEYSDRREEVRAKRCKNSGGVKSGGESGGVKRYTGVIVRECRRVLRKIK